MTPSLSTESRFSPRLRLLTFWLGSVGLWLALHDKFSTARGSGTLSHLEHLWSLVARPLGLKIGYPGNFFYDHNLLVPAVILSALLYAGVLSGVWWRQVSLRELCVWAVACGLPFIVLPRFQSTDMSDYLLRARMEFVYHLNPFIYPSHFVPFDPFFQTSSWPQVRWIYGPLYLLLLGPFAFIQRPVLAGLLLRTFTFGVHVADGALLATVIPGDRRRKIFIAAAYLLAPLFFIESAVNAHNDFVMIFFLLSAVFFDQRGNRFGVSLALGAAFLIKLYAVPVLICYVAAQLGRSVRDAVRAAAPAFALIVLFYLPFWAGPAVLTAPFDGGSSQMLIHSLLSVAMAVSYIPDRLLIHLGLALTMLFIGGGALFSLRTGRWLTAAAYTMFFWCTLSSGWYWPWYVAAPAALSFASGDRPLRWAALTLLVTDLAFYMEPTSWGHPAGPALAVYFVVFFVPNAVLALVWRLRNDALAHRLLLEVTAEPAASARRAGERRRFPRPAATLERRRATDLAAALRQRVAETVGDVQTPA